MFKHEDSADESIIEFDPVDETTDNTYDNSRDSSRDNSHDNTRDNTRDNSRDNTRDYARDYARDYTHDGTANGTRDTMQNGAQSSATDLATRRKANRPKVALAATITCPECGNGNRPQWLNKSQRGESYATTMFCEQCGCLMTVWAMRVDAQVVARK